MSTTAIFVEILIVGLQAFVWLALLLGVDKIVHLLEALKEYAALISMLVVALAYVIGIFVDRIADNFYKIFRYESETPAPVGLMRLRIMKESEGMAKFLEYQRSRLRIARATAFNLFLIILVGLIFVIRHYLENQNNADTNIELLMIGIGIIVLYIAIITTRRIDEAQIKRLVEAYNIIEGKGNDMSMPIAAAVCYRRTNKAIEFLLVRTKGGKRWTFPKGHLKSEPPEQLWEAASREAAEEAGVTGKIEKEPFTYYAYFKGGNTQPETVAAYLMSVESLREPDESERQPNWFSPEEAAERLSKRRRKKYANEHERVIQEALERLK